jgi:hypothetical protein
VSEDELQRLFEVLTNAARKGSRLRTRGSMGSKRPGETPEP